MSATQGRERTIDTISVRGPQPHNTNPWKERREWENSRIQKGRKQLGKISPAVLRGSPASIYAHKHTDEGPNHRV